jgi:hypothetical protein
MKKLFEIYEDNGRFILEATDFAKTLLNQNKGKLYNLKGVDFKELDIPVKPSARILQICEVIRHVSNGIEFGRAFEQVALENKISENSVRDKCCRQLGLTMLEFKTLVHAYIKSKNTKILEILKKSVSSRTANVDLVFIDERFNV